MRSKKNHRHVGFGSDRARDQDDTFEGPAQPFQPADEVDGRADRGEIEPVGGADIAPQYFAEMKRDAERQRRESPRAPRRIQMRHSGTGGGGGTERGIASAAGRSPAHGGDGQPAVADAPPDLPAKTLDFAGHAVRTGT